MNLSRLLPRRAVSMGFLGGGVVLFLDVLYHGGPSDSGWLPHLFLAAAFGLVLFVWGLLPESDDNEWPGMPRQELAEPPFIVKPTIRTRVSLVLLGLLFLGMLLRSILVILGLSEGGTLIYHLFFSVLSLWFLVACLKDCLLRIRVSESMLELRRLWGVSRIPLKTLSSTEKLSSWHMFPAFSLASAFRLRWTNSKGQAQQMILGFNPEHFHHGRALAAVLMSASGGNSARGDS